MTAADASVQRRAVRTFQQRARDRLQEELRSVFLFGSVARGNENAHESDVDLLVVLHDDVDNDEVETAVRDLAYDIELDYGVILSLIVWSAEEFERRKGRPFFQQARQDAERIYG